MTRRWTTFWLVSGLLLATASWVAVLFDGSAIGFTVIVGLGVPLLLWRRKWTALLLLLTLNPCAVLFGRSVLDYMRGRAYLTGAGLPRAESWNLRPDLRVHRFSGGCVVYPTRQLTMASHNAGVRAAAWVLGPMPGAYTGPYPDRDEARAAVDQRGEPVDVELLAEDKLIVAGRGITLRAGSGRILLKYYWPAFDPWRHDRPDAAAWRDPATQPSAAMIGEEVAVLRFADFDPYQPGPPSGTKPPPGVLVLIDAQRGRAFACYEYDDTTIHGPPFGLYQPE